MNGGRATGLLMRIYLWIFFIYLFGPLVIMAVATFNSSRFPTVTPWLGTTLKWFAALAADNQMWDALVVSLIVGAGVIVVSVPIGTGAALMLATMQGRIRTFLYGVMVSPLLTPGVIIGISHLVYWDRYFGIHGGIFVLIVAQSSFIIAYVMLMVMARLQRFDSTLEEAALDLGANHVQMFRRILLPHLRPSILAASVLAFLQSFENFNTSLFTRGLDNTLTVYIASKVRTGLTPAVNALGLILIVVTVVGAVLYEVLRRRERARAEQARREALVERPLRRLEAAAVAGS